VYKRQELDWLNNDLRAIENPAFGYTVGVNGERFISKNLSVNVGLGFSTYGQQVDSLNDLGLDLYKIQNRFIQLPIVAHYYFGEKNYRRPFVSFGYSLHYFLNTQTTYSYVGSSRELSFNTSGDIKRLNHAIRIGGGYDFVLDKKWNLKSEIFFSNFITPITSNGLKRYPMAVGFSILVSKH
jgi:outer membrane protein W